MSNVKIVIMAGGVGERFWPKSRKNRPKQFLTLSGEHSMLQETVNRLAPLASIEDVYIATGAIYKELVLEQLPGIPSENIIIEPCGRNTAPCIGLAAVHISKKFPNSAMIVLPSDHVIGNQPEFINILKSAIEASKKGSNLVTIGIKPTHPEVGYGYIKYHDSNDKKPYAVEKFVEKPNKETAIKYLEDGNYLWNSGMFIWQTETILSNFKMHMADCFDILNEIGNHIGLPDYENILNEKYPEMGSVSVDYGIMEHAENIYVIPGDFGWDDVGSWNSIERLNPTDKNNNMIKGEAKCIDVKNCTIDGTKRLIALVGLEDLVIVDTDDVLLVCHKDKTNNIKEVLSQLKEEKDRRL